MVLLQAEATSNASQRRADGIFWKMWNEPSRQDAHAMSTLSQRWNRMAWLGVYFY